MKNPGHAVATMDSPVSVSIGRIADIRTARHIFRELQADVRSGINEKYGTTEYSLHDWAKDARNSCHISLHLHSQIVQTIATRAFKAVQQYAFGKRGRPRFKGKNQMDSLEGKSNVTGIRWKDGKIFWGVSGARKDELELSVITDRKDKKGIEAHALACRMKFAMSIPIK